MSQDATSVSRFRRPAAVALLALGGPLAAAAPAAAVDGDDAAGAEAAAPAEATPAGAEVQEQPAWNAQGDSNSQERPSTTAGASARTQTSAQGRGDFGAVEEQPPPGSATAAPHDTSASVESSAGAQNQVSSEPGGQGQSQVGGPAKSQAGGQGRSHTGGQGQSMAAAAQDDADAGAAGASPGGTAVDAQVEDRSEAGGQGHVEATSVTHGGVTVSGSVRHAHARIRPSQELRGALREKARSAAKEQVRVRHAWHESAGHGRSSVSTKLAPKSAGARPHERSSGAEARAFVRVLQAAWQRGGPTTVNALLEFCFGSETSSQPLPGELSAVLAKLEGEEHGNGKGEEHGNGKGEEHGNGKGEEHGPGKGEEHGPGKGYEHGEGETPGKDVEGELSTPVAETPGATPAVPVVPMTPQSSAPSAPPVPATAPAAPAVPTTPVATAPSSGESTVLAESDTGGGGATPGGGSVNGGENSVGVGGAANTVVSRRGATAAQGSLPFTGLDLPLILFGGLGALLAGAALRRRVLQ